MEMSEVGSASTVLQKPLSAANLGGACMEVSKLAALALY